MMKRLFVKHKLGVFCSIVFSLIFCYSCEKNRGTENFSEDDLILKNFLDLAQTESENVLIRKRFTDSALSRLNKISNDSIKVKNLFKVANRYYNIGFYNEYYEVSRHICKITSASNDSLQYARGLSYLGDYFNNTNFPDSSFYYYLRAQKIYSKIKRPNERAEMHLRKSEVLWNQNDYFGCETESLEALKFLRSSNDHQKIYETLTTLGIVSNALNDFNSAHHYLNRAMDEILKNKLYIGNPIETTLNNIGNVFQNSGKNKEAVIKFQEALKTKNLSKTNPKLYSILLDNLAYSKLKLGDISNENVSLFEKSIRIKDSLGNYSGVVFGKCRLAEIYLKRKDYLSVRKLSEEALNIETISTTDKIRPLKILASLNIPNSNFYSEKYINITDSLQQAERKVKDKFARIQFETQEISQENDKLNAQNRNLVLIFCGILMIGLLLFVIRTQRAKNRELMLKQGQQKANEDIYNLMISQQNKIEEGRIREKKRIAQEIHDGVLGRLFGARLNLDSLNRVVEGEVRERTTNYLNELKNIEQDLREISHDLNREKTVLINNFVAILNNLFEEQAKNFPSEVSVNIDNHIVWEEISNNLKINIYRIFQEGLQNINKYAQASLIKVALHLEGEFLILEIQDDGIGFAVDRKKSGIGLQNMQSRTQECDGKFKIESQKGQGTKISIKFPISEEVSEEFAVNTDPVLA